MVTGAGGSIGSELVRQIIALQAQAARAAGKRRKPALPNRSSRRRRCASPPGRAVSEPPEIVCVLGSVLDAPRCGGSSSENAVETIYHAAAFKHVPLVEHNPVAGLRNNTFGTATLAEAAAACGVERFVLVSTDKAVRPTNIMGASKRLAEMILQARAAEGRGRTVFTMVRFGNVLDSSGSVVQRFRSQIEAGGPVTVTHPDMIRYFMSIPEAAALVIQAGAMASGGDVFVLDMGEPVKIDDLARAMIRLMGREVRDEAQPRRRHRHPVRRPARRREAVRGAADRRKCHPDRASAHHAQPGALPAQGQTRADAGRAGRRHGAGLGGATTRRRSAASSNSISSL